MSALRKKLANISILLWVLRTLIAVCCVCTLLVSIHRSWPLPGLGRWTWMLASQTDAYMNASEHVNGFYRNRLGCYRLNESEMTWTKIDSRLMQAVPGPHSYRHGYVRPPRFQRSLHTDVGYLQKVLRLGFCNEDLSTLMSCDPARDERGFQKYGRGEYQTVSFACGAK